MTKLIKTSEDKYHIETDNFDGVHLACYPHDITKQKLSLKNCKQIENGYDLDVLVEQEVKLHNTLSPKAFKRGVEIGLQKALEILGDKKYTKDDMLIAYQIGTNEGYEYCNLSKDETLEFMDKYTKQLELDFENTLERNEWNVEIEMETISDGLDEKGLPQFIKIPKLDADSCLILKRK
jgi:hypothetical protein